MHVKRMLSHCGKEQKPTGPRESPKRCVVTAGSAWQRAVSFGHKCQATLYSRGGRWWALVGAAEIYLRQAIICDDSADFKAINGVEEG
jgi:hypothetical protein